MLGQDISPFDEALSRPFLEEPAKKKWSLLSNSTTASTIASIVSDYYGNDYAPSSSDDDDYSSDGSLYEAPTLGGDGDDGDVEGDESVVFAGTGGYTEGLSQVQSSGSSRLTMLTSVDLDLALLQERHETVAEVHGMMSQINVIAKDLSGLIDAQEDDIENLQSLSIEARDHASAGVRQLLRINQQRETKQRRTYLLGMILVMVGILWIFGTLP